MHRTAIIIIAALLAASCTEHGKAGISDNDMKEYELYDYYVDEYGNEGIVACIYDYEKGDTYYKYTIVLSLDETVTTWGPMGTTVYDVNEDFNTAYPWGFFFGLEMNRRVMTIGAEKFPAFEWCLAKNNGEKHLHSSSWMLPTFSELGDDIFQRGDAISALNKKIKEYGGTPIATSTDDSSFYWTCVEDLEDVLEFADMELQAQSDFDPARRACPITSRFTLQSHKRKWTKDNEYRVRAIKYIYFECSPRDLS